MRKWMASEVRKVRRLRAQGMSASEIGVIVGRSRNSVISLWHRETEFPYMEAEREAAHRRRLLKIKNEGWALRQMHDEIAAGIARNWAITKAVREGGAAIPAIAQALGLSKQRVSQIIIKTLGQGLRESRKAA
jgi:hypothetical protein